MKVFVELRCSFGFVAISTTEVDIDLSKVITRLLECVHKPAVEFEVGDCIEDDMLFGRCKNTELAGMKRKTNVIVECVLAALFE